MKFAALLTLILASLLAPALYADTLPKFAVTRIGDDRFYGGGHRMRFAPDGKTLAVAHHDKLRLVDAATGRQLRVLPHFRPPNVKTAPPITTTVVEFAFTADGKRILSGDEDGGLHLWTVADGSETSWPFLHPGLATLCLAADGQSIFTAGFDGTLKQWQLPNMKEVKRWQAPGKEPILAIARVGKQLAGVTRDGTLFHWDPVTGKETRKVELGPVLLNVAFEFAARKFPTKGSTYPSFATYPRNVEFSPDGKRLAQHQGQQIWDVEAGKVIANLPPPKGPVYLTFSPDGKQVAAGPTQFKQPLRVYDAATGEETGKLDASRTFAVAFSPDGQTLAFTEDHAVRLWQPATKALVGGDGIGTVRDWDLSPDGKQVAFATREKGVRFYDAQTGKHLDTFSTGTKHAELLRHLPDGRTLALVFPGEGLLHYAKKGEQWQMVKRVAITEPPQEVHGPARLVPFGTTPTRLVDALTCKLQAGLAARNKYSNFSFSPDGRHLIVAVEIPSKTTPQFVPARREYQLFALPSLTLVRSIKAPERGLFGNWRFSPDGRLGVLDTNPVRVVEVLSGVDRLTVALPFRPTVLDFAPDGKSLLAGTAQGEIVVFGLPKGQVLYRTETVHQAAVKDIRVTPLRKTLSLGHDQTLLVWSADLWKGRNGYPSLKLDDDDLDLFYQLLKETGGENVGSALGSMIGGGEATVKFLKAKLTPAAGGEKVEAGDRLRASRALEILEHIGTPAARAVLTELARGHADALQTVEAKESLLRLSTP